MDTSVTARHEAKQFIRELLERNSMALSVLGDSLFYFGEMGMQEFRSAELMTGLLEEHGYEIERGISGFPTGFLARYGSGRPVIWDGFKDTLDDLYAEGVDGVPKWTEITLHAHMAGRPTLVPTLRRCFAYAKQHERVWFAPRREIAQWAL